MKILVLGSGCIGSVITFHLAQNTSFKEITVVDHNGAQFNHIKRLNISKKVNLIVADLSDQTTLKNIIAQHNLIIAAIPWPLTRIAIDVSIDMQLPFLSVTRPNYQDFYDLKRRLKDYSQPIIVGCGLEPGLTEIVTRNIARKFDKVTEFHIKCGGIPMNPSPPMNYKLVFGGNRLPLDPRVAYCFSNKMLKEVPRFSDVEQMSLDQVGTLEAWHDGMLPYFLENEEFYSLNSASQKTLRWPGFAEKANLLNELGFLSTEPILIENINVSPRSFVDHVLHSKVKFNDDDKDITILKIEVIGELGHKNVRQTFILIDYYDEVNHITSMGRTTGYTASIIADMLAKDEIEHHGLISPDECIKDNLYQKLLAKLKNENITFYETLEDIV